MGLVVKTTWQEGCEGQEEEKEAREGFGSDRGLQVIQESCECLFPPLLITTASLASTRLFSVPQYHLTRFHSSAPPPSSLLHSLATPLLDSPHYHLIHLLLHTTRTTVRLG
ncbi:hypothetical protein Pcinc_008616 [Petrolisthes cinctipes]|uniref:Uncharacterized protein n=1 Tax=Petrolisthes cinctipes TaxID=88211 RepID=A0AAE1G8H4_PETCI|nr:hypothetical protein Pcinc_008616 [Petrolisthes cinctipes]